VISCSLGRTGFTTQRCVIPKRLITVRWKVNQLLTSISARLCGMDWRDLQVYQYVLYKMTCIRSTPPASYRSHCMKSTLISSLSAYRPSTAINVCTRYAWVSFKQNVNVQLLQAAFYCSWSFVLSFFEFLSLLSDFTRGRAIWLFTYSHVAGRLLTSDRRTRALAEWWRCQASFASGNATEDTHVSRCRSICFVD